MRQNPNAPGPITYDHNDKNNKVFPNGFDKFFVNDDQINCPVDNCKLMKKGCDSEYDGGDGNNVAMMQKSPWSVTINHHIF